MRVGLYCGWDDPFEHLITRMCWATPYMRFNRDTQSATYKSLTYVPWQYPHDAALVFNFSPQEIQCPLEKTYVLILEPKEILGDNNPLSDPNTHPQAGAHIYSSCSGSKHPLALGRHICQSEIAPGYVRPSTSPLRCSMLCSPKDTTPYHRKRREIFHALMGAGLDIDFYGRELAPDGDRIMGEIKTYRKNVATWPYAFVIDFENSPDDVITEKYIDATLGAAVPITNSTAAAKIFPAGSFEYMDFDLSVNDIVSQIATVIAQPQLTQYDDPVFQAMIRLTRGTLNITEWLYQNLTVTEGS